jgi:hypothetical protein
VPSWTDDPVREVPSPSNELGVRQVALIDMANRVRLRTAPGQLALDQATAEEVTRRVDVPDLVEQPTHLAPPWLIQQEVIPFGDHQSRVRTDRDRAGDCLLGTAVEIGPEDGAGMRASNSSQETDESLAVESLWRALDRTKPEAIERLVRKVKAVERRDDGDSCAALLGDRRRKRSRERRLAGPRWPRDAEQEPPARRVDRRE